MNDIIKRLHDVSGFIQKEYGRVAAAACLATEAADEIVKLRTEVEQNYIDLEEYRRDVERLRGSLQRMLLEIDFMVESNIIPDVRNDIIFVDARAALEEKHE